MLTLTREDVRLGCRAANWRAALDQAAEALVEAGRVSAEYREGLLAREAPGLGGARQQAAVAAIAAEDENLHAAWHHAVEAGLAPLLDLAADSLGRYYEWQGYLHEGEGAFRAAAAWATLERGGRHLRLRARLMAWHGAFCTFAVGPGEALPPLQRSLDLLEVRGDRPAPGQRRMNGDRPGLRDGNQVSGLDELDRLIRRHQL